MNMIRRGFYLLPGFRSVLYRPIQIITGSEATGWPSFITTCLVYLGMTIVFECFYRLLKNAHP